MTTKTVDEWCAEQCGVRVKDHTNYLTIMPHSEVKVDGCSFWTIKDPRCREIVREHFSLITGPFGKNTWQCSNRSSPLFRYGKTIAEAEIACITAIYEASQ